MEFLKEEYSYIKNIRNLLQEGVNSKNKFSIRSKTVIYDNNLNYLDVSIFKGAEILVKPEFLSFEFYQYDLNKNNVIFLNSLKEIDFLFKNEVVFDFKVDNEENIYDYVTSITVTIGNEHIKTKNYNFIDFLSKKLNSISMSKIGKGINNLNKNEIELLKILNY